jgi:hypothetical protein
VLQTRVPRQQLAAELEGITSREVGQLVDEALEHEGVL